MPFSYMFITGEREGKEGWREREREHSFIQEVCLASTISSTKVIHIWEISRLCVPPDFVTKIVQHSIVLHIVWEISLSILGVCVCVCVCVCVSACAQVFTHERGSECGREMTSSEMFLFIKIIQCTCLRFNLYIFIGGMLSQVVSVFAFSFSYLCRCGTCAILCHSFH